MSQPPKLPSFNVWDALDMEPVQYMTIRYLDQAKAKAWDHLHLHNKHLRHPGTEEAFPQWMQMADACMFFTLPNGDINHEAVSIAYHAQASTRTYPFDASCPVGSPDVFHLDRYPNVPEIDPNGSDDSDPLIDESTETGRPHPSLTPSRGPGRAGGAPSPARGGPSTPRGARPRGTAGGAGSSSANPIVLDASEDEDAAKV